MSSAAPHLAETLGTLLDPGVIRSELERLLRSDQFKNSKRCMTLLNYLVEESLAGHGDELKERLIGVHVFGRKPDYDASADPVVRNAAIELRKRLAQFYDESGGNSGVRIELHSGTYRPGFRSLPQTPEIAPSSQPLPALRRHGRLARISLGVAVAVSCVLGVLLYHFWVRSKLELEKSSAALAHAAGIAASSSSPAAVGSDAVRILAGNLQSGTYIDRFGNQWLSDRYFTGGRTSQNSTNFFFPPADPELFRTMRVGTFNYDIPLKPKQVYELRLYFFEPQFRYGNKVGGDGENERLFQVRANGDVILDNFDIIEDSGFASVTVRAFKEITAAQDGKLHLQFISQRADAILNAIELLPAADHSIPPIRIHSGLFYYTDHAGNRWSPDNFYIGGQLFDSGSPVTETQDPDLYSAARLGNFQYAIPVPPGRYGLTLYFSETWFRSPGRRVFDISCNGNTLIRRMDIFEQVGFSHVLQKSFHGLEPNGQGKLLISFSPIVNYGSISAIEVVDESRY